MAFTPVLMGLTLGLQAVGMALQFKGANDAADQQSQLSLLNAQASTQAARQEGALGMMQGKLNAALAAKDQQAADAAATNLRQQAEVGTKAAQIDIRRSREEYERLLASQRVQAAKSGVLDTTGSPLALLTQTAERGQQEADQLRYQDEINRRGLYNQATAAQNQGVMAQIQGMSAMSSGYGAQNRAAQGVSQANLNLYGARAQAQAMRNGATGNLIAGVGNMASSAYSMYRATPSTGATSTQARY